MKKHQFEEITLGISLIASMIAWAIGLEWAAYAFLFKAGVDFWCLIRVIIKKRSKERIVITRKGDDISIQTKWRKGELLSIMQQATKHIEEREK